jgi:hypothetical protein
LLLRRYGRLSAQLNPANVRKIEAFDVILVNRWQEKTVATADAVGGAIVKVEG